MIQLTRIALIAVITAGPATNSKSPQTDGKSPTDVYRMPPVELARLADAPLTPLLIRGPNPDWALLLHVPTLLTIADLSQPELKLAGLRLNPQNNDQTRSLYYKKIQLLPLSGGAPQMVTGVPDGSRIRHVEWSPDGKRIAFGVSRDNSLELWIAGVPDGRATRVANVLLNGTHPQVPFHWLSDSRTLLCRTVAVDRGAAPEAARVPSGPVTDQSEDGRKAPTHTYEDLLKNPHDAALFEYYLSTQVQRITVDGSSVLLGKTGLIIRAVPSPDSRYILVEALHRPFSYLVPEERFPRRVEVWDSKGLVVREIADLPLADQVPVSFDAVPEGPRRFEWRADSPATLSWVEAQDGGDPRTEAAIRDRVFTLAAPFTGKPIPLVSLAMRFKELRWGTDSVALVYEGRWKDRRTRGWRVWPAAPEKKPQLVFDFSSEDRYHDPGKPVMRRTPKGTWVLRTAEDGKSLFLFGEGGSPEGDRPFLDRLDLGTRKISRLWRSEPPSFEAPVDLLDDHGNQLLTRRESVDVPPNFFVRDLAKRSDRMLTNFPHPTPELKGVTRELVHYQRADGVKLSGTLYLPPNHSPSKGPLPLLMWVYPREFKSLVAAGQVTTSPYRFVQVTPFSALPFVARGYAILENPTLPIVGEGKAEANDTYVEQLVAGAKAAVDEMVRRGVADPNRVAIGGHSYGAFTAANLLAHSDLFRAGIARSGAYNRSLTPFGFQSEERTFWEVPETYLKMSPFAYADKIRAPLLLIHGMEDDNSGTFPVQSERLFQALKGFGAPARLVMLPREAHGYRARESVLHVLWEMDQWLEKYVKNAPPRKVATGKLN